MWRSGDSRRRRQAAVTEMVATAVRTGRFREPWKGAPSVWDHYRTEAELLTELHTQWRTALAGEIYLAIESGRGDLHADVARAYRRVLDSHLGVRQILEARADHPAIASALRKEAALLAAAAGDGLLGVDAA